MIARLSLNQATIKYADLATALRVTPSSPARASWVSLVKLRASRTRSYSLLTRTPVAGTGREI